MTDKPAIRPRVEQGVTTTFQSCCLHARIQDACKRQDGTVDLARVERAVFSDGQRVVIERDM